MQKRGTQRLQSLYRSFWTEVDPLDNARLDRTLATVHGLLQAEGMNEAAEVVRAFPARAEITGHDNWNGGIDLWTVLLEAPIPEYARLGSRRSQIEEQITARLKLTLEDETDDWYAAKIVPAMERRPDWREANSELPRQVRLNILDGMRLEKISWRGELDDVSFLNRIYDLEKLSSSDARFKDAAGDIWQHCINNDDWEPDWIYTDERFKLISGSAENFLRFLCEVVHPVVRPDRDEAIKLVSHFNQQLRRSGWEIFEDERIGGRPRFTSQRLEHHGRRSVSRARTVADALDAGSMAKAIERLEQAIESDPDLAIGTAKELVEACCKSILTKRSVDFSRSADLGDLTKLISKELNLVPEEVSDQAKGAENIRLILRNLTQLTNNLAQLRGLYGTGHGRDGGHRGLQPRHARLAAASAIAFIDFVASTYRYKETERD